MITYEEFREECLTVAENRSQYLRKGQAIFNYVDEKYGVAREAQFVHKIDCFYLDEKIEEFIRCAYIILKDLNE
jgi:hypothetical protein